MKKSKAAVVLAVILIATVGLVYYSSLVLSTTGKGEDMSIPLGLDLSGGVSITYQVVDDNPSSEDMKDTIYKLQKRVEGYSTEALAYQVGDDRITVEIPGVTDANEILEELGNPGSLEFQLSDGTVYMTGDEIANAQAGTQDNGYGGSEYVVQLTMTDEGAEIFAEVTADNIGNNLPIVYDGEVISNPTVQSAISGGSAVITGMSSYEEAETLATQIRVGALSLELKELESSVVGAQLGSSAISSSLKAAAIGLAIIIIFMIAVYSIMGVAASIALVIYTTMVIATLQLFEITLTLPGIAGIILGIGMAVDANVVIFSRIREEIAAGKSVRNAIQLGFQKALSAILDGNITTFIAAIVLILLGSGSVKGFAYTLMISIVFSLFTALLVTRWVMNSLYGLGVTNEKFYGKAKQVKTIDFVGKRAIFFGISLAVIAVGFISMGVNGAKGNHALNFGLDFMGGTSTTADFGKDYSIEEIESEIVPAVAEITGDNDIQTNKVEGTTQITIKTRTLDLDEREALNQALTGDFDVAEDTITSQSISSTISGEMRSDAIVAVLVASICMLIYIRFRFGDIRFGASAVLALLHDVLVVLTVYAVLRISVGSTFIACMLTIIGYSINDTIIIFDRLRENLGKHAGTKLTRATLMDVANTSVTQTLSRTINTSLTTFVMVLMLFILGVSSIRDFSLPLMAGLICGSYSSVFISCSLWYVMKTRVGKNKVTE